MADYYDKPRDFYDRPHDGVPRETRYVDGSSVAGAYGIWFVVGGVVLALALLFALTYVPADTTAPVGDRNTVTIENTPPAAIPEAGPETGLAPLAPGAEPEADPAPAPEATPAPAEPEAAPAPSGN